LKSVSPEQGDHTSMSTLSCLVNLIFVGPLRTRALEVCNRQRQPAKCGREVLQRGVAERCCREVFQKGVAMHLVRGE
jgi:hypothetical protein